MSPSAVQNMARYNRPLISIKCWLWSPLREKWSVLQKLVIFFQRKNYEIFKVKYQKVPQVRESERVSESFLANLSKVFSKRCSAAVYRNRYDTKCTIYRYIPICWCQKWMNLKYFDTNMKLDFLAFRKIYFVLYLMHFNVIHIWHFQFW